MNETPVLVLNAGSSSLKYQLLVPETAAVRAKGIIERIGEAGSAIADHDAAVRAMTDELTPRVLILMRSACVLSATASSTVARISAIPRSSTTMCSMRSRT